MSIQAIIFSKNRPLQLHATLTSLFFYANDVSNVRIHVLYKATTEAFSLGYSHVAQDMARFSQVNWVEEKDFKADLLALLQVQVKSKPLRRLWEHLTIWRTRLRSEYLLFLVDDNLFVHPFCFQEITDTLKANSRAIGFSLRLGRNTTSCYSLQCQQPLPDFQSTPVGLSFLWPGQTGDFGYPLEVSSSIYRSADLFPLLRHLPYNNPNRLEQALAASSRLFIRRLPSLHCFNQSVAFCAPVNKVQSVFDNRSGDAIKFSAEFLNNLFLDGYRVDVLALNGLVPSAAHMEIEIPLLKSSERLV